MTWWQVDAILIAVTLPIAAVVGLLRVRRWSHAVLLAQILPLAEIGAIAIAVSPGAEPQMTPLLWLVVVLIAIDLVVMGWSIVARRRLLRGPISVADVDRVNGRARWSRLLTITAISSLLLNFEPWLGIANFVANAIWICVWVPTRMRAYHMATSVEIAAPPQGVFPYLIDPATWPLYRSSTEMQLVSIEPTGPLAVQSRIVTRRPVTSGRHLKPYVVESTIEVIEVVPDRSYSTVWLDRPSEHATTELQVLESGSRIQFRLYGVTGFWLAAMGVSLDLRGLLAKRSAEINGNYVKLKQVLESVPTQ
jgi:uncharacterized protein YndB with AHSA1/START domain